MARRWCAPRVDAPPMPHAARCLYPPPPSVPRPRQLAPRPRASRQVLASEEPLVSILFCDLLDFHSIVATLTPSELITMLDHIWSLFDGLSERYGITKMETVGATYMAVGGLDMAGTGRRRNPMSPDEPR